MAGSGKSMAMLATLMFAMLLSGSMVNAARPIGVNGGEIAAMHPHGRQLNFFFRRFHGCGWLFWWHCGPRFYVKPVPVAVPVPVPTPAPEEEEEEEDDKRRKLQSVADTDSTLPLAVNGGDATTSLQGNGRELNFFWGWRHGCWFWWCNKGYHHGHHGYGYGRKLQSSNSRKLNLFFGKFYWPFWLRPVKVVYQPPKYKEPKYEEPKY